MTKTILVIGTYDTKQDELDFLAGTIRAQGGAVRRMDVSVLSDPAEPTEISKHDVAAAGGSTIAAISALGDENAAFLVMAKGAAALAARQYAAGAFDGMIVLGGTMGTDLALDVAQALPLGVPKYIVSTVAFSPLIPPDRLAPDVQMILWAGGLYGINDICRSSLAQAAGAVLGAARAATPPKFDAPLIGMTSLGTSCLAYMKHLKPALEARGFDVAIFHATGMGGMAYEALAAEGAFACVFDFCMQEFVNMLAGSAVSAGPSRLTGAGASATPQIVAPGAIDLLDFACWQDIPAKYADLPFHQHNRLITSAVLPEADRRAAVSALQERLSAARGPVEVLLPLRGVEEWDKPGGPTHDPAGLAAIIEAMRAQRWSLTEVDAHINDAAFADAALKVFDGWVADAKVKT